MKKLFLTVFLLVASFLLVACSSNSLVIYIPKEYISEDVVIAFEKEYGVKVDLRTFDSNEIALTQARINKYDLIIPSDYAIEEFAKEDLIQTLDWSKINFNKADFNENLVPVINELKTQGFDMLNYAMPYFWGTVGLLYDNTKFNQEQVILNGWNLLADQSLSRMVYDSPRDAFMASLARNNPPKMLSNATEADITAAKDWLISTKGANMVLQSDEILDQAVGGKVPFDIAMVYSGDAVYILQETQGYSFAIPQTSNVWVDGFVIPKNATNVDLAYDFINFVSSYEQNLENTSYMGYTSIRQDVLTELLNDEEFSYDERIEYAFNIDVTKFNYEIYRYNNELKSWIDENYDLFTFAK